MSMEPRPRPRASRRWLLVVVPLFLLVLALCVALVVRRAGLTTPTTGPDGRPAVPGTQSTRQPGLALPVYHE